MSVFAEFVNLIGRLAAVDFARSENDLSSRLGRLFESVGLHPVLDTSSGRETRKRPDISVYIDRGTADLAGAAEIAVESKLPDEIPGSLIDALFLPPLWNEKFLPYSRAHISAIRWFCLTTFDRFLFVAIDDEVRAMLVSGQDDADLYSDHIRRHAVIFSIQNSSDEWQGWFRTNLSADALRPPPLSTVLDTTQIVDKRQLDQFADELANIVAGGEGVEEPRSALIHSVRFEGQSLSELPPSVAASLMVFVLSQHPSMTPEGAREYINAHFAEQVDNFVSASIHSLIGRLFACKVLEDAFCIGVSPPLLSPDKYVFHTNEYDDLDAAGLVSTVFSRMAALERGTPLVVQNLARTGSFFNWIEGRVDPQSFRRLFALFATRGFRQLSGDLLGRFFEHYSQRIDSRRRRALGQYYTPPEIVSFMWRESLLIAERSQALNDIRVLDPGAGSAGFLTEGARRLAAVDVPEFWDRLVGFDLDPQVIGVAYVNLFLAILGSMRRTEAEQVTTLRLYPTDALDPSNQSRLSAFLPLLTAEPLREYLQTQITLAADDKRPGAYHLVIGNPPYKNNSTRTLAQVAETFPPLLRTSRANAQARTRNIRDDYAWFIAAADFYIGDRGLIAFIVSDSICAAQSYRFMRLDILRNYKPHSIYHLGTGIFSDVGPRISFAILFLEKRSEPLGHDLTLEPFNYYDLREEPPAARLSALVAAGANDRSLLPEPQRHTPNEEHGHAFIPVGDVAQQMRRRGVPLVGRTGRRLFLKKWPGFITAFDGLFRAAEKDELSLRLRSFFEAASDRRPETSIARLCESLNMVDDDAARLAKLVDEAREQGLTFEPTRLKRTLSGSTPNDDRWYPSAALTSWTYYEPRLLVPRNTNEGRARGWGSMTQWRDPASHNIAPKLVYTTATDPRRGLKAFVVRDELYVKIHGGARQQFHYTGCDNPTLQPRLGGEPNNLTAEALDFFQEFADRGRNAEDLLLYVAGVYNSDYSFEFVSANGGDTLPIPLDQFTLATEVADIGRRLRDLTFLRVAFTEQDELNGSDIAYDVFGLADEADFQVRATGGGRFRPETSLLRGPQTVEALSALIQESQEALNTAVASLFGLGALRAVDAQTG